MLFLAKTIKVSIYSLILRKILGFIIPKTCFFQVNKFPDFLKLPSKKKILLFLSFDVDCLCDSTAIPELCNLLDQKSISCNWAIIGKLLEENPDDYKPIMERKDEIINHGYSPHNSINSKGVYYASLFYHKMSFSEIEKEVRANQEAIHKHLGLSPIGFRTPHFGTFQKKEQLWQLYKILNENRILYSSSVHSLVQNVYDLQNNPHNIAEIPFSTRAGSTMSIFDSWEYLAAPNRRRTPQQFFPHFKRIINYALESKNPILLNFYFDPSHVVKNDGFKQCLNLIEENRKSIWMGLYPDILPKTCLSRKTSPYTF